MSFIKKFLIVMISFVVCITLVFLGLYLSVEPKIKIKGDKEVVLNLNDEYKEEGYEAYILGKNVSDDVKITNDIDTTSVGSYEVKYYLSNKFIRRDNYAVRSVKVVDDINPEINLIGSDVSIFIGNDYVELGYSAVDNYDGDITNKVNVTNNIDKNKVGEYEVKYVVSDSSDNVVEVKRRVFVKEKFNDRGIGIPILMYHFFYDEANGEIGANSNWMEISDFEEQLKYLDDNDYYFPTWEEVVLFVDGKISLPEKSIVITADDGHDSFFRLAVPVINKYDVKVTSFIVTSWTDATVLDKYRSDKVDFQTHTHDMHQGGCSGGHGGLFRCINYNKGYDDLSKSVQILGASDAIAYPFGDVTDNVLDITRDVGVKLGFTTKYGKVYRGMDKLQLPRIRMNKGVSLNSFINSIK